MLKKLFSLLLVLMISGLVLTMVSCDDDEDDDDGDGTSYSITFKINGESYELDKGPSQSGGVPTLNYDSDDGETSIVAAASSINMDEGEQDEMIMIALKGQVSGTGTYKEADDEVVGVLYDQDGSYDFSSMDFDYISQGDVTVEITDYSDTEVKGTFSGTVKKTDTGAPLQLTDGEFTIKNTE